METKTCSRCKLSLPLDNFYVKYKTPRIIRYSECKKCRLEITRNYNKKPERREYAQSYYQKNKDTIRSKQNEYYKENKEHVTKLKKDWLQNNKEKRQDTIRKYNKKLREQFLDMYGRVCVCCGETHVEFLTIEHKLGQRGIKRSKKETGKFAYLTAIQEYRPDLYEVLCMNCNFSKGRYGYCPHHKENKHDNS